MTRSMRLAAALLAIVMVFAIAGCDQTKEANAAIEAANAKAKEYTALDETISKLMDEASAVSMTPEGVKPGIGALDAATAEFEKRKVIIAAVKAEFEKIDAYDVSEAKKTYAKQQVEIADLLGQMDDLGIQLIADTKALYQLIESGSTDATRAEELSAAIEATSQKLTDLDKTVAEKESASDTYFTDQGLGK
jgi:uncharacterized lipoprotein YehR (DUF1307 family)